MPPRSNWKGFLKLSLVSVPVKAYTASNTGTEIRLNQLHANCHNRVRYQKTCPEHGELKSEDIVSGYEYAKGQYVVVDPAELDKLRTESDRSVNIAGFVSPEMVDAMYLAGRTYYLVPDGAVGQKPYALLRQVMIEEKVYALAQVVLSGREQVVMVRPVDDLLTMSVLQYDARVKKPSAFTDELTENELKKEELSLTRTLIEASRIEDLDYSQYRDLYVEKLTQLIEAKAEGQEIVSVPDPEEPKILNLMDALKESVARAQGAAQKGETDGKKMKRKMSPSSSRKASARKRKSS